MRRFLACIILASSLFGTTVHAHGPQVGPGCGDLSKFMNVHCHKLGDFGCCSRWVYDHEPPSPSPPPTSFNVTGFGEHCSRAWAAQRATNDARARCNPGTWTITPSETQLGGIRTPACPIEPLHDSTGFSSNGVYDQVTVHGTCTR